MLSPWRWSVRASVDSHLAGRNSSGRKEMDQKRTSKQQQQQACTACSFSLSLSRGAEHCPSTWPGVQTRILIIIYGNPAQRHALKRDGDDAASRAGRRGRWLEEDDATAREVKRSGEGKVLEGLSLAGAYYERSGCGWTRIVDASGGGPRGGGRRMDSGIFLPRFRLAPLKAGCRYLMR